jgi:3-deoxy-7-phosphoheptulonate synthase
MIIVMRPGHTAEQLEAVERRVRELGYASHLIRGVERVVIGCVGREDKSPLARLAMMPGVEQAIPILKPYKLVGREVKPEPTVLDVAGIKIGGGHLAVMAGPCSVESEEQILASAQAAKKAGATFLRGGAFKPRTSPYSFQGMEEEGLKLLASAAKETGLRVVTEVVSVETVGLVANYADLLQIGARNSQNFPLLSAAGKSGKPVLLKRGMSSKISEFLLAAEYILKEGNYNVILCERGIRTFETATRFTLDLNAVPVIRELSHLPIVVDPSHGAGDSRYVEAMARAAIAAGADGLIIEIHPNPAEALSDGQQSLTFEEFEHLMGEVRKIAGAMGLTM